jgi:two-component system invasion response regulator UvrY
MVVLALFLLPSRGAMLEETNMPQADVSVRVLIVDDQASFRRAACSVIELTPGFVVVGEAETGEASLDSACALQPDLVLMDVHLPGIDGLEASRRMLAANETHRPVILLLSTYEAGEYADDQIDCGAAGYLAKAAFGSESLSGAWAVAIAST